MLLIDPDAFARLPMTVTLSKFCEWTGLSKWTVMEMRRTGQIRVFQSGSRCRYLKSEIARLCNFPLHTTGPARSIRQD